MKSAKMNRLGKSILLDMKQTKNIVSLGALISAEKRNVLRKPYKQSVKVHSFRSHYFLVDLKRND